MGPKWGLRGIRFLLAACGNPEKQFPSVLVGGTNGKGSTSAVLERILRSAGYRTGLYTSPHLVRFEERIRVGGRVISGPKLQALCARLLPLSEKQRSSFFECATAIALRHFADEGVEIAVLEVGMGGRLDSTNVVDPRLSVITGIGLDHMEFLGETLERIAFEKAGISRRGRLTVLGGGGRSRSLLETACLRRGARVLHAREAAPLKATTLRPGEMEVEDRRGGRVVTPLVGRHQVANFECALAAAEALSLQGFRISRPDIARGLGEVRWPGRFEWLPEEGVLLDVAHNPQAAAAFAKTWDEVFGRPGVGVIGMLADKDVKGVVRRLGGCARVWIATSPRAARALSPEGMGKALGARPHLLEPDVPRAIRRALAVRRRREPVFVIGSLYTVGEAIPALGCHVSATL